MADNADVQSVEQLESFLQHSKSFRQKLLKELETLHAELQRLSNWIEHEATSYWQQELRKAQLQFAEAQDTLSRCMSYVRESERRPCTEEKKRVKVTKERRALCEEKLQTARAAARAWEQDRQKNLNKLQRARDMAEAELQVAIHHLEAQVQTLAEYAGLRSAAVRSTSKSTTSKREEAEE